jgi:hypothetical protein
MARDARGRGLSVYLAQLTPPIPGRRRSIPDSMIRHMNDEVRVIAAGEGATLVDLYTALASGRMADEFFARIRETMETR